MKNTFGNSITLSIFGESHGDSIGAILDGLAPGIEINYDYINEALDKRRPYGRISTQRKEPDAFEIVSGVFNGYTTGTPLTIIIKNRDTKSKDYSILKDTPRPSHADYTAECKYHGYQDYRGGGHFSGRITAPLVVAGAILSYALLKKGIKIGTHISMLKGVFDRAMAPTDIDLINKKLFPTLSDEKGAKMIKLIECAASSGDSVGGVLETIIDGVMAGVGEPFFDSVESRLSHMLFSIPGVKGVEFGLGFGFANVFGSEANDFFTVDNSTIKTKTNNSGGINGGITNGMPITLRTAIRPTPSIYREQNTVSLSEMKDTSLLLEGRHDPAIIHRVRAVVDAACAIVIADLLTERFGTDYLKD